MKEINPYKIGSRILNKNNRILYKYLYYKSVQNNREIPVIKRVKGPYLYDFDQNRYVDFYMSGGNLIMGHVVSQFTKIVKSWFNRGYSSGYPYLQSNQMLANRLGKMFDIYGREYYYLFFLNSPEDAFLSALYLLKMFGLRTGGYFTGQYSGKYYEIFGLKNAEINYSDEDYDFLIFKPETEELLHQADLLINKDKDKNLVTVMDERDFPSVYLQHNLNRWLDADIRILGNWISSGYDFGTVLVSKNILNSFFNGYSGLLYYLNNFRFPPLYKIKGAIAFLSTLVKKGGIKKLGELQRFFIEEINRINKNKGSYFKMDGGLIFLNKNKIKDYDGFWYRMIKNGYYFPYNCELPVFVSLGCEKEMLKKTAKDLCRVLEG